MLGSCRPPSQQATIASILGKHLHSGPSSTENDETLVQIRRDLKPPFSRMADFLDRV